MKKEKLYDTIIIGAGIAGSTAAIYAARKRMKFLFISENFGGQFLESGEVLNYPGIKKTTGTEFSSIMEDQLKFNNVKYTLARVKKIEKKGSNFAVSTENKKYHARSVIITAGARARELNVPGEQEFKNKGVHYCAICDGPLFSGKTLVVIGGGDSALEAVDFLLNIARKIYLINISEKFTAHEYLQERVRKHKKVRIINNARTMEVVGDRFVKGIKYEQKGKIKILPVEGIFVEIGRIPNTEFVKGLLKLDEHKHIVIDKATQTSVEGIFAAGDCSSVHEYQFVIAAGQGCTALIKASRYLARKKP